MSRLSLNSLHMLQQEVEDDHFSIIVCCQPDRHRAKFEPSKLCLHTVAKLGKEIQNFCRRMICNRLNNRREGGGWETGRRDGR